MNYERRNQIAEMIKKQGTVKNAELMQKFGISIETVRRDLAALEQRGVLERVYGGAVGKSFLNVEPDYANREQLHFDEKSGIATAAAKLIAPGDTVFFDLGTTMLTLAQQINPADHITAFTNSLRTAIALSGRDCEVILSGGKLRPGELSVSGAVASETMRQFNIDKAFIGAAGITEDGITDFIPEEADLRKQVIRNARTVIVLADHSKFGIRSMCKVCALDEIDILITNAKTPLKIRKEAESRGVKVIVV